MGKTSRMLGSALAFAFMISSVAPSRAQNVVDGFAARTFKSANGETLPYRLFVPDSKARTASLPIVIYLHGSGGSGIDNLKQIGQGSTAATHLWTQAQMQAKHPAFVLAPQTPEGPEWHSTGNDIAPTAARVLELLTSLSREFKIDANRVYLIGQSMGGFGTWDLVSKRPALFAAAIPLCGGGDPKRVVVARNVPVWAFHGAKDEVVPVSRTREMVAALKAVGSPVKYTEYPEAGHTVWTVAFAEPTLPDWLFAQKRVR
jgi:predicted peptidase